MKLYVYCVADREPGFTKPLVGLAGSEVEFLTFDNLVVGTSKFSGEVVEVNRANVLLHDAVIRETFSQSTVLPFRFGTLLSATSLETYIRSKRPALEERLESLRNRVEMSVKIVCRNRGPERSSNKKQDLELGKGTAFLVAKRDELLLDQEFDREARAVAESLKERVSEMVRNELVAVHPKQRLLSASFLIELGMDSVFRQIVDRFSVERPDLHFLTSGPWPPYTFANIELEFQTHFGVS